MNPSFERSGFEGPDFEKPDVTTTRPHFRRWIARFATAIARRVNFILPQRDPRRSPQWDHRLEERTRIARELHDTLFQGFFCASMRLHVAMDQVPDDSPHKPTLQRVLELMDRAVEDGRKVVRGLRFAEIADLNLEHAFSRVRDDLSLPESQTAFRVFVKGSARRLTASARSEVYYIGREALLNALRHSGAADVEVEVEYTARRLRVAVRDNGCGIDPQIVRSGRDGHWGLIGMRERAASIGARLRLLSNAGAGTEIEVTVPAEVAYDSFRGTASELRFANEQRPLGLALIRD